MPLFINKTVICCAVFAVTSFSAPHQSRITEPGLRPDVAAIKPVRYLSKTAEQAWVCIGTSRYTNSAPASALPQWELTVRDTTIFDSTANKTVYMNSRDVQGWEPSGLAQCDSFFYSDGKLACQIQTFGGYDFTKWIYEYSNNGKTVERNIFHKRITDTSWTPYDRILTTYSVPYVTSETPYQSLPEDVIIESYVEFPRTDADSWYTYLAIKKVDAECTPTKSVYTVADSSGKITSKTTYTFDSTEHYAKNGIEVLYQVLDPATDVLTNYSKLVYYHNPEVMEHGHQEYLWNNSSSTWEISTSLIKAYDSHFNDTLVLWVDHHTVESVRDTNSFAFLERTYDSNNNNTMIIEIDGKTGAYTYKTVNTFALIDIQSKTQGPKRYSQPKPDIIRNGLSFAGKGLSEVTIYNASGRAIASSSAQQGSNKVVLPQRVGGSIAPGSYIAVVRTNSGTCSIKLPIYR